MASISLQEVTFQPGVKDHLESSFLNQKAIAQVGEEVCKQRWNSLLRALSYPPAYTVLRVSTLRHSKDDTKQHLTQVLRQQYCHKDRPPAEVHDHTHLDDTLVVTSSDVAGTRRAPVSPSSKQVIVDRLCGLAVMRGADIYAPGVLAASLDTVEGDIVSVHVDVNGLCRRGWTKPFEGAKVFLGNGRAVMSRRELFVTSSEPRGVAVRLCEPIFDCPSLNGVLTDRLFLQNLPSIVVGHVLKPAAGQRVLDMCAAPGGKTTHLASLMRDQGVVIALDKSQNKINKVKHNAKRLGLSCVKAFAYDSIQACGRDLKRLPDHDTEINAPPYPPGSFDCILLDAPCSGLGQRPQIGSQLQLGELKSYPAYQRKFLTTAVELLRPGGTLVYSTCTVTLAENEGMVEWVLNTYAQLGLAQQIPHLGGRGFEGTGLDVQHLTKLQRFHPVSAHASACPTHCNLDTIGFFIAKFIKRRDCEPTD